MSQIDLFSKVKPLFSGLDINDKYLQQLEDIKMLSVWTK